MLPILSCGRREPGPPRCPGSKTFPDGVGVFWRHQQTQMLYLVHHQDDSGLDSYWPMENNMTVFGFGRSNLSKYLSQVPGYFTVGFARTNDLGNISQIIDAAYRDLGITIGSWRHCHPCKPKFS